MRNVMAYPLLKESISFHTKRLSAFTHNTHISKGIVFIRNISSHKHSISLVKGYRANNTTCLQC